MEINSYKHNYTTKYEIRIEEIISTIQTDKNDKKTSTEKSSNFKICYNQINFKSRRLFEKICRIIL